MACTHLASLPFGAAGLTGAGLGFAAAGLTGGALTGALAVGLAVGLTAGLTLGWRLAAFGQLVLMNGRVRLLAPTSYNRGESKKRTNFF